MTVPDKVRIQLREALWKTAAQIGWRSLATGEKAKYYERWTRDPEIGGVLAHYMNPGKIRVYLKDTLLKGYGGQRTSDPFPALRALGIPAAPDTLERYTKPHGLLLRDRRLVCWGRAEDWKLVLMAMHERSFAQNVHAFGAVLCNARARFNDMNARKMVQDAADKLGVEQLKWLED